MTNKRMHDVLLEIYGYAQSAVSQRAPSDDAIIAEHIERVRDIARDAMAELRREAA